MATSQEKQDLIDDIRFPYKFYRIKIKGHGSDDVLYKLNKYGVDYWSRELQKNPSAIIDYLHDCYNFNVNENLPPYAHFHADLTSQIGIEYGVTFTGCKLSITQVDEDDIGANDIKTIIQDTPITSLNYPTIQLEKTQLPESEHVLVHSRHEVGTFIHNILKIDHKFDINHLRFSVLERAKGDIVIQGVVYKNQELSTYYVDTNDINETTDIWKP